jgi:ribosomal protein L40E
MPPTVACPKCNARVPADARFCQVCGARTDGAARNSKRTGGRSRGKTWLAIGLVLVLLVGAVAVVSGTFRSGGDSTGTIATSDALKSMEGMAGPMPAWLSSASKEVKTEYAWAVDHHDELQYFPCYCGCYDNAGHDSNYECYFQHNGNGQITGYDQHAYG